ncbi:hypothetical protein ACFVX3_20015 [Rhodococcus erythropolis]
MRADDYGITRGDGLFESSSVVNGQMQALDAHLSRLDSSAKLLDLPELDLAILEAA